MYKKEQYIQYLCDFRDPMGVLERTPLPSIKSRLQYMQEMCLQLTLCIIKESQVHYQP